MTTIALTAHAAPDRAFRMPVIYVALSAMLALAIAASLMIGLKAYSPLQIWTAFSRPDASEAAIVITNLRLPRALMAPLVGAALGMAGVVVQTLARNRIASPDTLGLNAGASLAVVLASFALGVTSLPGLSLAAALGALAAGLLVFGIAAGAGGLSPVKIVLVGVTIAGLGHAFVEVILTTREAVFEQLLFWLAGAVVDRPISLVANGIPFVVAGAVLAAILAPALNALQADDTTAAGVGVPLGLVRAGAFVAISLLTGAAVAMAGPVSFVGLVVPHAARHLAGLRHRRQLIVAALVGAIYVTLADIAARFVIYPSEAPVGAITAVVGGIVLLALLKRRAA